MPDVLTMDLETARGLAERLVGQTDRLIRQLEREHGRGWSDTIIGAEVLACLARQACWFSSRGRDAFYAGALFGLPDDDPETAQTILHLLPVELQAGLVPLIRESTTRTRGRGKTWLLQHAGTEWGDRFERVVAAHCGSEGAPQASFLLGIALVRLHQRHPPTRFILPVLDASTSTPATPQDVH